MQLKAAKLNNDRLNGNKLFMHKFKNFSTTSVRTSLKINVIHALISILKHEHQELKNMLDTLPIGIFKTDNKGRVILS